MRCDRCNINFPDDVALQSVPRSFRSSRKTLCQRCVQDGKRAVERFSFLSLLVYPALYVLLPREARPVFANLGLFFLSMSLAVIPHEIGHALAAWCSGLRVFRIVFGRGRPYARFTLPWSGALVEVRPLMLQGFVVAAAKSRHWCRTRLSIYILGGPAANVLIAACAAGFINWNDFFRESLQRVSPWLAIFAGNLLMTLGALWLRRTSLPHAPGTDGWQLRRIGRLPPASDRDVRLTIAQMSVDRLMLRGEYAHAAREAEAAIAEVGPDPTLLAAAISANASLLHLGEAERYAACMLATPNLPFEAQAQVLFACAWIELLRDTEASRAEARLHAEAGRQLSPFADTLLLIDGALDVLTGDLETGKRALRVGLSRIDEENMRASLHAMLALAAACAGDVRNARREMKRARRCDANCETFALVERRMAALQGTAACPATTNPSMTPNATTMTSTPTTTMTATMNTTQTTIVR